MTSLINRNNSQRSQTSQNSKSTIKQSPIPLQSSDQFIQSPPPFVRPPSINSLSHSPKIISRSVSQASFTNSSNSTTTATSASAIINNDKFIKLILKHFKKLEIGLNKFNSKNNGIYSTNLLRTILLPFLRIDYLQKVQETTHKSLVSIFVPLMIKWWSSLLHYLINCNTISSIDRSVYLECISRIISRPEWYSLVDPIYSRSYNDLLILTLDYSIRRLSNIKHIPLSISAFIGKVFAYSFFKLKNVSNALLFLLNIKQKIFEENYAIFNQYYSNNEELKKLYKIFPKHLHYLINYKGLKLRNHEKSIINCLMPPQHPVEGIKDPNGIWVSRWLNSDSDIFNSFLRHYFTIIDNLFAKEPLLINGTFLLNLPGFNVILSHIYQITKVSITRISTNNSKVKYPEFSVNDFNDKQNQIYFNSIFKVFRTFRDMKFCHTLFSDDLVNFMDLILKDFASKVTIYDFNKNCLILNIVYEFVNYFEVVDWGFWLNSIRLMIEKTDHVQILLKNLSILFNIWNNIPELYETKIEWLNNGQTFKQSLIDWLISDEIMEHFLIHYNSIVRNYYSRLLIWRVIGINNFENSTSINISLNIEQKLTKYYKVFNKFYDGSNNQYFKPDNPLINKKFVILPVSDNEESIYNVEPVNDEEVGLKKTHPYEIFDEAIYSCSNLSTEVETNDDKRSNSLVNSIGKIFKILTTDKPAEPKKLSSSSKSGSLTSLSTLSLTSRSSSPSLLSFNSTPTSLTDLSSSTSSTEETDLKSSIYKLPPEVVRSHYKFDLINDHDAIREKFFLMNNRYVLRNRDFYGMPNEPKIPTISIFINSDIYNKIYISTENLLINRPQVSQTISLDTCKKFRKIDYVNLGKSLFEWNLLVEEFECFLISKIENDKYNDLTNLNEVNYFKKLIPLLTIDNSKYLNAA